MNDLADKATELHTEAANWPPQVEAAARADYVIRMGLTVLNGVDHECQSSALPATNKPSKDWRLIRVVDAEGKHHLFYRERDDE